MNLKIQPYASRTGTLKTLEIFKKYGWRLLLTPDNFSLPKGFNYCLDNGAFSAFSQNKKWDEKAFLRLLNRFGPGSDFVICPDIVCGGEDSLRLSLKFLPICLNKAPKVLIPIQDGFKSENLIPYLSQRVGLFLGGSKEYRTKTLSYWVAVAHGANCHFHVAKVNSLSSIQTCLFYGVSSFDGSGPSRFSSQALRLGRGINNLERQTPLFSPMRSDPFADL